MPNKKIAFIIDSLSGGGAEKIVLRLAQALADQGLEIHIILLRKVVDYTTSTDYSIHCLTTDGIATPICWSIWGVSLADCILAKKLRQYVHKLSEARHFNLIISTLHKTNYITYLAKIHPVYYCIVNAFSKEVQEIMRRKGSYRAKRFFKRYHKVYHQQHIVGVSHGVCNDFIQHISPKSICTIYNPIDFNKTKQLATEYVANIPSDDYIVHVARFSRQKRYDWLFKAIQQLSTSHKLVLLTKPSPALLEMVAKFKLFKRVIIPGFQTNPYPWIKHAKLLVLSSEWEGFGNVIVEALICGTPVVSTNCSSGPGEILTGELAHWLVPINDPQALSQKIHKALQTDIEINPKLLGKFSINRICKQYLALCS